MVTLKNKSPLTVVGINTGHDGGCCIIHGNKMVAISEERLNRVKHSSGFLYSLFYCLKSLRITINDLDAIVFSSYHKAIDNGFQGQLESLGIPKEKFFSIDHHLSHAWGSYCFSEFDEAVIVIMDGLGNTTDTESYYHAQGNSLKKVGGNDPERSIYKGIGRAYESFTNFIGWDATCAGKTMGLAPYGKFYGENITLFDIDENGAVASKLEGKYDYAAIDFVRNNQLTNLENVLYQKDKAADAASFIQFHTEKAISKLVGILTNKYHTRNVCLGGGVALNAVTNQKLLDNNIVDKLFIPPFPCDTGQCIGNVLAFLAEKGMIIREHLPNAYLGAEYTTEEIEDVLFKRQTHFALPYEVKKTEFDIKNYENKADLQLKVAELLHSGSIVGWFSGASEIGPRALGARSILANPLIADMQQQLNSRVKHRESFRPFAALVPEECVDTYFHSAKVDNRFMLFVTKIKDAFIGIVPGITHVDKSCRIQTLNNNDNRDLHQLIKIFEEKSGYPLLINTSFNDNNEPIVETPKDAIRHVALGHIDYLVIDSKYLVSKKNHD